MLACFSTAAHIGADGLLLCGVMTLESASSSQVAIFGAGRCLPLDR